MYNKAKVLLFGHWKTVNITPFYGMMPFYLRLCESSNDKVQSMSWEILKKLPLQKISFFFLSTKKKKKKKKKSKMKETESRSQIARHVNSTFNGLLSL